MLRIVLEATPGREWYSVAKDFQPFFAAVIALAAALIAYGSNQRSKTREFKEAERVKQDELRRERFSILVRTIGTIDQLLLRMDDLSKGFKPLIDAEGARTIAVAKLERVLTIVAPIQLNEEFDFLDRGSDLRALGVKQQYQIFHVALILRDVSIGLELIKKEKIEVSKTMLSAILANADRLKIRGTEVRGEFEKAVGLIIQR